MDTIICKYLSLNKNNNNVSEISSNVKYHSKEEKHAMIEGNHDVSVISFNITINTGNNIINDNCKDNDKDMSMNDINSISSSTIDCIQILDTLDTKISSQAPALLPVHCIPFINPFAYHNLDTINQVSINTLVI